MSKADFDTCTKIGMVSSRVDTGCIEVIVVSMSEAKMASDYFFPIYGKEPVNS